MQAIYVCTHGKTAIEMIKSAEMICGEQKNVRGTFFEVGESLEDLLFRVQKDLKEMDIEEGILFLTDIKGGTPYNTIVQILSQYKNVELLAGVNIPILVDIFIRRMTTKKIKIDQCFLTNARDSISKFELIKTEEEDF